MESDCPEPDIKPECAIPGLTASKLCRRGLTPRNISPEKRSRNIQVECQKKNNVEKAIQNCMPNVIDMDITEYADDKVETYANIVDRKLRDLESRRGNKRFVDVNVVTDSVNQLVCG